MPEKKQESFTVTDRRLFTPEGELRKDNDAAQETAATQSAAAPKPATPERATPEASTAEASAPEGAVPPPPTADEQREQADAYRKSAKELDARVELSGHSAKELVMTFERFLASLYMTAMLQLGLMHEEGGQPRIDLIGARQTIDTLSLIGEKTKGNLTSTEDNFLQNSLYELRMAYVEVTNALARPPQAPMQNKSTGT
jgi:Domain of unknown function (DUF1844)